MPRSISKSPALERIIASPEHSFRCVSHDFPCEVARWNYHPEHELHLIRRSTGRVFVGDYIGSFGPGHLAFVNSNVPHNWVSDLHPDEVVADRDLVIQFDPGLLEKAASLFPELRSFLPSLEVFNRSWQFHDDCARAGASLMEDISTATGVTRLIRFLELLHLLATTKDRTPLATPSYVPTLDQAASDQIEKAMRFILARLPHEVSMEEVATHVGMSSSSFSRFFKRNTAHNFVDYMRKLRIGEASRLLAETQRPITDICFDVGYANISSFNRSFREERGMTPSAYRRLSRAID
ncbi:AraC family transcriptional regulator [Chelatococcus asaccharovorans]|nr:AraC family transcriptional regulator [Chelatococcus asaccharovorans]CAH1692899.1 AraC family transcriptional regulator [Chelatococcus asaccharovorans]